MSQRPAADLCDQPTAEQSQQCWFALVLLSVTFACMHLFWLVVYFGWSLWTARLAGQPREAGQAVRRLGIKVQDGALTGAGCKKEDEMCERMEVLSYLVVVGYALGSLTALTWRPKRGKLTRASST